MKKNNKFVFWAPRISIILFALFLAIFSFDVFDGSYGFFDAILAFFMHNMPSLVLLAILLISWKNDLFGFVIFFLLAISSVIGIIILNIISSEGTRFIPILITTAIITIFVGILFYIG